MFKDEDFETHPAFGVVGFSRVSGNPGKLFGSNLTTHGSYIMLRISQAKRRHDLGRDLVMADRRERAIEVSLSAEQFAQLLTTMNVGDGVPCTITRRDGKRVPDMPAGEKSEPERIQENFEENTKEFTAQLGVGIKEARESLRGKAPMRRKERDHIAEVLEWVLREVQSNMPFHLRQFQESTDRTVNQAKAEVDSFVTTVAFNAGMDKLREVMAGDGPKMLPERTEKWTCAECGKWFAVGEVPATVCPYCNSRDIDLWETTEGGS